MRVLLVEPNYRSKFPPLGLLRISSFLKSRGFEPTFVIGKDKQAAKETWDKIFISSLFTFELNRTIQTINFYANSVINPSDDIVIGGVGATLMPEFVRENSKCTVIPGPLCNPDMLGFGEDPIANQIPDYDILSKVEKKYTPNNAYFTRVTTGCIRKCSFCAVPILEPNFGYVQGLTEQVNGVKQKYGEKQDLIILDNNILALKNLDSVIEEIQDLGFSAGQKLNGKKRVVDFNQGIDVRLMTPKIAKLLSKIAVHPVRLAFDNVSTEKEYRQGVQYLAEAGIQYITTYVMFNFRDTPEDFYRRLEIDLELNDKFAIRITGFPMRYCPIKDTDRHYISPNWNWRYLRGIQCILAATHGMVSPNPSFFRLAFGKDAQEFKRIISMPDDYIIYRSQNFGKALNWKRRFMDLPLSEQSELIRFLGSIHDKSALAENVDPKYSHLLAHYQDRPKLSDTEELIENVDSSSISDNSAGDINLTIGGLRFIQTTATTG